MVSTTFYTKIIRILALLIFVPSFSACMEGNEQEDLLPKPTMAATLEPAQVEVTPTSAPSQVEITPTKVSFSSLPSVATSTPYAYPTKEEIIFPDDGIVRIVVDEFFYEPRVVTITVGSTVEWVPTGVTEHTIVSMGNQPGWPRDGNVGGFGSSPFRVTFKVPGVYPYYCSNHPGVMDGKIVVISEDVSESP